MSLGTNIKSLRLFRGLSQRKLAEKLDKSVNTVANWEKDLSSPDLKTAKDICDVLNVTPNELLGYEVNQEYAEYIIELETSKDIVEELHKQYEKIGKQLDAYTKKFGKLL